MRDISCSCENCFKCPTAIQLGVGRNSINLIGCPCVRSQQVRAQRLGKNTALLPPDSTSRLAPFSPNLAFTMSNDKDSDHVAALLKNMGDMRHRLMVPGTNGSGTMTPDDHKLENNMYVLEF